MDESALHTPEEVRTIIKNAKLHESELTELTQVLKFNCDDSSSDDLRLLQLDSDLLQEILNGNDLVFKGDANENAVLCTTNKTYDIKEAETSNSLLLVPNLLWANETRSEPTQIADDSLNKSNTSDASPNTSMNRSTGSDDAPISPRKLDRKDILKTFNTYYEVRPCKPRLGKLKTLLAASKYSGPEHEYKIDKDNLFSEERLLDVVQASKCELTIGLGMIGATKIDGFYRLLEFDYEFRILSYMLDLIEENSWPLDRISREVTFDSLNALAPMPILERMFQFYTVVSMEEDGYTYHRYIDEKVSRFLANVLLKTSGKFNLNDFLQAWTESVPAGMKAEESFLKGMAIIDRESNPQVIWAFSESTLPENINDRFKILFQTKEKWTVDEMAPYIECFTTDKLNVNSLLTKHARPFTDGGVRYYCAKHSC